MELRAGRASAIRVPETGAGVVSLTTDGRPVLSTGEGRAKGSPFALGMNLLVPFSNRISRPFPFEGVVHPVPANLPGEPFAIHGDGFQRALRVEAQAPDRAELTLSGKIGPFVHEARVTYHLRETALETRLTMVNRAPVALPYGGGFHPWFPRQAGTRIGFQADGYWPQDDRHLPRTQAPVPAPDGLTFDPPSALPEAWVNTTFAGWNGVATIRQQGLGIKLSAAGCESLILYSPGAYAAFFCLEPASHPVDAHNLPGQPGLKRLAPGDQMTLGLTLSWTTEPEGAPR